MLKKRFFVFFCFLFFTLCYSVVPTASRGEGRLPDEPLLEQNKQQTEQAPVILQAPEQQTETDQPAAAKDPGGAPHSSKPLVTRAVARNIALFTERIRERFTLWLQRSGKYLDLMKEILRQNKVPEDIAFLPLIESGFSPNAYSVARAVGPWQFIAETGKRYGLKIDWWRDERRDPVKSTEAAANYLKDLYEMFGSWNLAMAAYNAGEGKILKALNRSRSDDYWALLNTRYIKDETKEYVPRFIAAKQIAMDPKAYGFENLAYHSPFEYDEVVIDKPVDLDVAASCAQTTETAVKELNPELRRWSTPPNVTSYALRIPAGKKDLFIENLAKIPEEERFTIAAYTVKKGDTLKKIASKTGVPIGVINELNDGMKVLKTGETIYLPPKEKFCMDRDDRATMKKAVYQKPKKKRSNKKIIASVNKKDSYVND
ncbi:MAG TPA: transglycosylase SLT domain-containing protein [Thermodesulfovibrionales bacterium]|nr:transglycosylase SLT domain-containing protein [Thermodesulfovibrionales bacterium]